MGGYAPGLRSFRIGKGHATKLALYPGAGPRERDVPAGTALLQVSWRANEITKTDSQPDLAAEMRARA